jgi:K+-transporting ATPase ATPase C chain
MYKEQIRPAIIMFIILTMITGIFYTAFVTVVTQIFFHTEANGSIIYKDGKAVGSVLIGQSFDDPKYLWGRISATTPMPYNSASSSGSNIAASNPVLLDTVKARIEKLRAADPDNDMPIPVDLVTSSASGLDPHISQAGAYYQVQRIATRRGIPTDVVKGIIDKNTTGRLCGVIGEPVVNVLKVNLDLDSYKR